MVFSYFFSAFVTLSFLCFLHLTFYYHFSIIQLTYPSLFLLLLFLTFYWFLDQGFKHFYLFSFLVPGAVGALKHATSDDDQVFYHCAIAVASIFYLCKNQPCNLYPIFLIAFFHSFFVTLSVIFYFSHLAFYYHLIIIQLSHPSLFLLFLFLIFYWFLRQML
jgi:hypothetical protein